MLLHEMHGGGCDDARILVQRRVVRQVIEAVADAARRLVVDMALETDRIARHATDRTSGGCKRLAVGRPTCTCCQAGGASCQTHGSGFQELPTVRFILHEGSPVSVEFDEGYAWPNEGGELKPNR